jgi:hypothetical protein
MEVVWTCVMRITGCSGDREVAYMSIGTLRRYLKQDIDYRGPESRRRDRAVVVGAY